MQTHVFSSSPGDAQAARAARPSPTAIVIVGQRAGELDEPRNFIRQAARTIKAGKAIGRKHSATALKAIGLMMAAASRATLIGRWSTTPGYDPVPDLVALRDLAAARLGPVRERDHPVTQFRNEVADTIRVLGEPTS